jgi:drug/metabolite transporter (DMT)-like permease
MAALLALLLADRTSMTPAGAGYAVLSGALASGIGYAIWYAALPSLRATTAAIVQLAVPPIAALGGVVLLHEPLTPRLLVAAAAVLGGIALAVVSGVPQPRANDNQERPGPPGTGRLG